MAAKYLRKVLRHKRFVFTEACKLGIPWLGFIHDSSKFTSMEFKAYSAYNFSGENSKEVETAFDVAWNSHQKRNKHHWQAWLYVRRDSLVATNEIEVCSHIIERETFGGRRPERISPGLIPIWRTEILVNDSDGARCLRCGKKFPLDIFSALPMPERYIYEMVADWRGAGLAYGNPNTVEWYENNKHNKVMHPETRERVEWLLGLTE